MLLKNGAEESQTLDHKATLVARCSGRRTGREDFEERQRVGCGDAYFALRGALHDAQEDAFRDPSSPV